MEELTIFNNQEFGDIRVIDRNGEPWFVAADVCKALELGDTHKAVERLDNDEKDRNLIPTLGGKQEMTTISESGLYSLVLGSRKPEARQFKRWITHEVIPEIRKTGMYATPVTIDAIIKNPENFIKLFEEYQASRKENEELSRKNAVLADINQSQAKLIAEMEPDSEYCKKVLRCTNAIPITIIAKDYGLGAKKMNKTLKDLGIQFKASKDTWVLKQPYASREYTKTKTYVDDYGVPHIHTYWLQKGRQFIYETLKKNGIFPILDTEGIDPTGDEDINFRIGDE